MANYEQPDYVEKRLRYFDGQFLKDQDFVDEQKYFIDRLRRQARALGASGVVEGLMIAPEVDRVTVTPGAALDGQGRLLVVGAQTPVPLRDYRGRTVRLLIQYAEEASDQAQEGSAGYARFHERPRLGVIEMTEAAPDDAVILVGLTIDGDGQVAIDPAVRQHTGVRLPNDGEPEQWPTLRSGGADQVELMGNLKLSGELESGGSGHLAGDLAIGTPDSKSKLSVAGGAIIGGDGAAPSGGLLVEGRVDAGSSNPSDTLIVDPKGAGSILIGNPNTSNGGHTSLRLGISGASDGHGVIQSIRSSGSAFGDLALNPAGGRVGIGTATELAARLHVQGSAGPGQAVLIDNREIKFRGDGQTHFSLFANRTQNTLSIENTSAVGQAGRAGSVLMSIASHGAVSVNGQVTSNGSILTSDARWKQNIQPLKNGLEKLLRLQGVTFDWKRDDYPEMNFQSGGQIGLIAQDVERVLPEVVQENAEGYKTVSYSHLVAVLVEAIKEVDRKCEHLLEKVETLEREISAPRPEKSSARA